MSWSVRRVFEYYNFSREREREREREKRHVTFEKTDESERRERWSNDFTHLSLHPAITFIAVLKHLFDADFFQTLSPFQSAKITKVEAPASH